MSDAEFSGSADAGERLEILYRDDGIVAINKPSGLLVHRTVLDRHETRFAVQMLRDQIGRHVHPVHRLDRGTSGVLLFALDRELAARLSGDFQSGAVDKRYLAVVRGVPPEAGLIDHALSREPDAFEFVPSGGPGAPQPAQTRFSRLASIELPCCVDRYPTTRYSLLALEPLSGRRHQIRRHLKHIAHPVIGDSTHGNGRHNRFIAETFSCRRLLLVCSSMAFRHPLSGQRVVVEADPGPEFRGLLDRFGWSLPDPVAKG